MNIAHITIMFLLPHGAVYEKPHFVHMYPSISQCAQDQIAVQAVARTMWPDAIALCRETRAPFYSMRPQNKR